MDEGIAADNTRSCLTQAGEGRIDALYYRGEQIRTFKKAVILVRRS